MIYLLIFLILIIIWYVVWLEIRDWRMVNYRAKPGDIDAELALMKLEKSHFGRYQLFHERQSKEYRQWLSQQLPPTNKQVEPVKNTNREGK